MTTYPEVSLDSLRARAVKGGYILVIKLDSKKRIHVGSLGLISFPKGFYAYLGSALGGFQSRLNPDGASQKILWTTLNSDQVGDRTIIERYGLVSLGSPIFSRPTTKQVPSGRKARSTSVQISRRADSRLVFEAWDTRLRRITRKRRNWLVSFSMIRCTAVCLCCWNAWGLQS